MKTRISKIIKAIISIFTASLAVFTVMLISSRTLAWAYNFYGHYYSNELEPFNFELFPKHFNEYVFAMLSAIIGYVLYLFSLRMFINPIKDIYHSITLISKGDYSVRIQPKGFRAIRVVAKRINVMAQELDATETIRNDLVNNFSHELKTPLASIAGFAKLIKTHNLPDDSREEYIDIIINESERMSNLSRDILSLTALNNMSILPNVEEFNLSEQIRLVAVILKDKWEEKNITLSFEFDEFTVNGNKDMLQQIWINLLDNAIKFSPKNSVITIEIERHDKFISVRVTDEGIGMSEEAIKHAFERFYQADVEHKTEGNGIGLAVAKRICELHNGDIYVKSSSSTGTTFEIILPVEQ